MLDNNIKLNHLARENSPYLLQHADNPVDWYPWGEEAIEKARREDKPIILSIGYSTCHWCHVMEKESFSDPNIADIMNKYYVSIKVDREERPDIDSIYISAVTIMTGSAGWPLNVFLLPDTLKPFYGGTYFPPTPRPGITGWPDLLNHIAGIWRDSNKRKKIVTSADTVTQLMEQYLTDGAEANSTETDLNRSTLDACFNHFESIYDSRSGGFGKAPKFPSPTNQNFLMFYHDSESGKSDNGHKALKMATHTLDAMARGGIYDHIGGGFHRYATDAHWFLPHFEKMLYDNAQLIVNYLDAFQRTKNEFYAQIVREAINYTFRNLRHPIGVFYSAEDADSQPGEMGGGSEKEASHHKIEGAYYVWSLKEIEDVLGDQTAKIFAFRYGVNREGNVENDPFGEFKGKNVLYIKHSIEKTADTFEKTTTDIIDILKSAKQALYLARFKRYRPHLDDKVITAWNGLMISALARAYQVLGDKQYLMAAKTAADFLFTDLYDEKTRQLYRIWREGERAVPGVASDYAFLIKGLLDLYQADFDPSWLSWAVELTEEQIKLFYDTDNGGFFMTREDHDRNLILRVKEDSDSVMPSAGSVAAMNLVRLFYFTHDEKYLATAEKTIKAVISKTKDHPGFAPHMLMALGAATAKPVQIVIAGEKGAENTTKLIKAASTSASLGKTIILVESAEQKKKLARHLPFIGSLKTVNDTPTAYVCFNKSCKPPVTRPDDLLRLLESVDQGNKHNMILEKATFGSGCFWKPEAVFSRIEGVVSTSVGYMGGRVENPTYQEVCVGETGHAEVVEVEYDPSTVSYDQLLETFWKIHDPTTLNRQGPDIGEQYRSVIFYHSEAQKNAAVKSKEALEKSDLYINKIVTQIKPAPAYYKAEEYHQQYYFK